MPAGVRIVSDWMRDAGYYTANVKKLPASFKFDGTGKTDWNFTHRDKPLDGDDWSELNTDKAEDRAALARLRASLEKWIVDSDDQGRTPEPPEVANPDYSCRV